MAARDDLKAHLQQQQKPLSVYALTSSEPVLLGEAIAALRSRALGGNADFNRDEFRAGETPIERVVDAASTLPMMAPSRWVLLTDLHKLKAKEHGPLIAYLDRPSPKTVLCLAGEKLDQRTKLAIKLNSLGALFALEPPRPYEIGDWIRRRAQQRKLSIDADAAQLLGDLIGVDLGALDMAVDKLAVYAGERSTITAEDVEAVVAPTKIDRIFKLTDAVGARDLGRASLQLRNALGGGESGLMVLSMIARQLRHLAQLKELQRDGVASAEIARRLGIRPSLVEPLAGQARRYDTAELCAALAAVREADVRLKSTKLDAGVVLDRLLVEIISAGGPARDR